MREIDQLDETGDSHALVSITVPVSGDLDPTAIVLGSRRAADRWSCWEQPERGGFSLAALGQVREVVSRGEGRFGDLERDANRIVASIDRRGSQGAPAGAGPVFVGGAAFDPAGCTDPEWSSLPPASLVLPEIAISRFEDTAWLTVVMDISGGRGEAVARVEARLSALQEASLPPALSAIDEVGSVRIVEGSEGWGPAAYEEAVGGITRRVADGEIEKVVLARSIRIERDYAYDPAVAFAALRGAFPSCFCFAIGTPELTFCGASPELLVRRSGPLAATVALAGSARRSADPAVDAHLGESLLRSAKDRAEHEIVVERIKKALQPISVWVDSSDEPQLAQISNIQHLATPIRAQLSDSETVMSLVARLHPTPAVGGEPRTEALRVISEVEGMDRGWYAGPVGWMDATGDGEFCVALRSALLRDRAATLFAGAGIVENSEPASELAETELKLGALLPLLS